MVVFNTDDFVSESLYLPGDIRLRVWTRKEFANDALDVLNMTERIFEYGLMEIFKNVDETALPSKIDMFIIPEYPVTKKNNLKQFYLFLISLMQFLITDFLYSVKRTFCLNFQVPARAICSELLF